MYTKRRQRHFFVTLLFRGWLWHTDLISYNFWTMSEQRPCPGNDPHCVENPQQCHAGDLQGMFNWWAINHTDVSIIYNFASDFYEYKDLSIAVFEQKRGWLCITRWLSKYHTYLICCIYCRLLNFATEVISIRRNICSFRTLLIWYFHMNILGTYILFSFSDFVYLGIIYSFTQKVKFLKLTLWKKIPVTMKNDRIATKWF